jgi:hypothetical protein
MKESWKEGDAKMLACLFFLLQKNKSVEMEIAKENK